jgi:Beta protein
MYVPVLRWKAAEISAVRELTSTQRQRLKPLFEFVPQTFKDLPLQRAVALNARDIAVNWGWDRPCLVDPSPLGPSVAATTYALLDHQPHLNATLVTPFRPIVEPRVLRELKRVKTLGLGVRISAYEFRQVGFHESLTRLIEQTGVAVTSIDLIIDFGGITAPPRNIFQIITAIEALGEWRSVTVLAGAFPPDLSKLKKNDQHFLPRHEWTAYCAYIQAGGTANYGDYTIQHAVFEEHEGKGMNFSASIRYASLTDWVIMRGESVREAGYEQWPASAQLLCERREFLGATFSAGDNYIKTMSEQQEKTGGPKEWLTAGINHHLALVAYQLEHLAEMLTRSAARYEVPADWPSRIS